MLPASTTNTPQSPLTQLADIHLPEPISPWPLAPGWYLLVALVIALAMGMYYWRRHRQQQRYRRLALTQLQQAQTKYQHDADLAAYLQAINLLLRRTAASAGAPPAALSLSGSNWLHWLDQSATKLPGRFSDQAALLVSAAYQKSPDKLLTSDLAPLYQLAQAWITQHKRQRFSVALPGITAKQSPANQSPASQYTTTNTQEPNHV